MLVSRIGLFFDGSGNNMWNDKVIDDGSATNIVKLYDIYKLSSYEVLYEEGIGTRSYANGETFSKEQLKEIKNGKSKYDFYNSVSLLIGWGVNDISYNMMQKLDAKIDKILDENDEVVDILVDVYGFSRGASIARDFINNFNEKYHEFININIDFVGLFDTVSSILTRHNNYYAGLNINLNSGSARKIVHLVAKDEFRYNFPLNSIMYEDKTLPVNMKEIELLGSHSDIGGGYPNEYNDDVRVDISSIKYKNDVDKLEQIKDVYINAYEEKLKVSILSDKKKTITFQYEVKEQRTNELSIVALHKMYQEIILHGVRLKPLEEIEGDTHIISDLKNYANALLNDEDISLYEKDVKPYINISSSHSFSEKIGDVIRDSFMDKVIAVKAEKRDIFYNAPKKAFLESRVGSFTFKDNNDKDKKLQALEKEANDNGYELEISYLPKEIFNVYYTMKRVPQNEYNLILLESDGLDTLNELRGRFLKIYDDITNKKESTN